MQTYQPAMAEQFAQLLAQREEELRQALAAIHADDQPATPQEVSDFKDVALRNAEAALDSQQTERLERTLKRIAAARRRLATDRYGICQDCGDAIDLRRLLALPEAELCTACQSVHEPHH